MRFSLVPFLAPSFLLVYAIAADDSPYWERKEIQRGRDLNQDGYRSLKESNVPLKTRSCVLLERISAPGRGSISMKREQEWRCKFKGDGIRKLKGLPQNFFYDRKDEIESGRTTLVFTYPADMADAYIDKKHPDLESFTVPQGAEIQLDNDGGDLLMRRRAAVANEGNHTILIVRVTDPFGNAPKSTAAMLSDNIFGTGDDLHNLRSQYLACSAGKLDFVPVVGSNIINGVVEYQVPFPLRALPSDKVEDWLEENIEGDVGEKNWTLTIYVLPDSVLFFGAAAYTWVGSTHAVFMDRYSSNLLVLMHEIGHTLGHRHSGQGRLSYGDGTCMMGAHVYEDEAPQMCFNGAKSWFFGWYQDRHVFLDASSTSWNGELIGINDYINGESTDEKQAVIVRVASESGSDLFVMYNRQEGINSQVHEMGDLVTIVEQGASDGQSWLLGGFSENSVPFRASNWNSEGRDLVIQVCSFQSGTPDFASVIIFIEDGNNDIFCPGDAQQNPLDEIAVDTRENDIKTVDLVVETGKDAYRERPSGVMKKSAMAHILFSSQWQFQAFRFRSEGKSKIPADAKIVSASFLVLPADNSNSFDAEIRGYAIGHGSGRSPAFTGQDRFITKAPKTNARVKISKLPEWNSDSYFELLDVSPIVQEIVDRDDYVGGNPMTIFLFGESTGPTRSIRTAMDDDSGPVLRVQYIEKGVSASGESNNAGPVDGNPLDDNPKDENSSNGNPPTDENPSDTTNDKVAVMVITDTKDDYKEDSAGRPRYKTKKQLLFDSANERQAYRFQNVVVPKDATIAEATLEMVGAGSLENPMSGRIYGENVGNAGPFKFKRNQLKKTKKTKKSVKIENLPTWKLNEYNVIGDVTEIIQGIVKRYDFKSGNAIKLILINEGSTSLRKVKTADSKAGAKLTIRYRS